MSKRTTPRATEQAASADRLAALFAGWDAGGHGTLARRLAHAVRNAVASGLLADGTRLPAERTLAAALSVSRATVTTALDELRADGLVESRRGSGSFVRGPHRSAALGTRIAEHFSSTALIDLSSGNSPDASHLPPVKIDVAMLIADGGGPGVQALGLPALRRAIAERHTRQGRITDVDEIHVTAGAHHAVALAVTCCAGRGTPVAVEDPSYPGIFDIVDQIGAVPVTVRSDHHGLVPADLDRVLTDQRPPVLYVQTGPHNPTGRVPSPLRLGELAEVLDRHDTTVVEDVALADLAFDGRVGLELADLCRRTTVVSVGSFSKVAWGGLRIGWLRGPAPFVERTMYLRLGNDLGASVPSQLLAVQLEPHLDHLATTRRRTLAESVHRAIELLAGDLPEWRIVPPRGGSVLWAELPVDDATAYVALARRHGVHVAPGSIAHPGRTPDPHVRICVDRSWPIVEAGVRRLHLAWRDLISAPGHVAG